MPMVDDGVFPRFSIENGSSEWRECRRLFYVGVTRAMNDLHVAFSRQHGMSPFLADLVGSLDV
jgi:superfamily I DNA/RNA helicase